MNLTLLLVFLLILLVAFFASLLWLFVQIYLYKVGKEFVVVRHQDRTPFTVKEISERSMVMVSEMDIVNMGRQCATIMDAFLRVQLPFEQYDGIAAWGRVELADAPREDSYFEAVLIQKGDRIRVRMELTLLARKNLSLLEALDDMVDLPVEFIYQETGRTPCHYSKARIVISADQLLRSAERALSQEGTANSEKEGNEARSVSLEKSGEDKEENADGKE